MPIKHIFLDMDGVLSDFFSAALRIHGRLELLDEWPRGQRDIPGVLGLSRRAYWNKIDEQGSVFWASLQPYPWLDELIQAAREVAPFTILTAPSLAPGCSEGKIRWMYEYFPKVEGRSFANYMIGSQKHLLAQPGHLLIDDSESNTDAFNSSGGQAILFPQVWNRNHAVCSPVEYVKSKLAEFAR
ncbi:MAG: hypothetical protein KDB27_15975 [Planctomycetales bacterium]|nr:hypothetical protein [Planctomycetales bacterium]